MMMPKEFAEMFRWVREKGFRADIAQVRQEYPQLLTFAGWLKKHSGEHRLWPDKPVPRKATQPRVRTLLARIVIQVFQERDPTTLQSCPRAWTRFCDQSQT
jgi:hypothetical protein